MQQALSGVMQKVHLLMERFHSVLIVKVLLVHIMKDSADKASAQGGMSQLVLHCLCHADDGVLLAEQDKTIASLDNTSDSFCFHDVIFQVGFEF